MDIITIGLTGLVWVAPLLIVGVILVLIVRKKKGMLTPKEMLDKRLECGEIDQKTYKTHLRALEEKDIK